MRIKLNAFQAVHWKQGAFITSPNQNSNVKLNLLLFVGGTITSPDPQIGLQRARALLSMLIMPSYALDIRFSNLTTLPSPVGTNSNLNNFPW